MASSARRALSPCVGTFMGGVLFSHLRAVPPPPRALQVRARASAGGLSPEQQAFLDRKVREVRSKALTLLFLGPPSMTLA